MPWKKKKVINNERLLPYTLKKFIIVVKLNAIKYFHLEVTYTGTVHAKTQGQRLHYNLAPLCCLDINKRNRSAHILPVKDLRCKGGTFYYCKSHSNSFMLVYVLVKWSLALTIHYPLLLTLECLTDYVRIIDQMHPGEHPAVPVLHVQFLGIVEDSVVLF